jgi:DNA ligase-1
MSTSFLSLSELLEAVEATKKRLVIIDLTANYLKTLSPQEVEPAVNMMVGRAFPKYSQKTLDVSWSTITHVLEGISKFSWDLFSQAMAATGDIGSATKLVLEGAKTRKQIQLAERSLTVLEVRRTLDAVAQSSEAKGQEPKKNVS